MLLHHIKLFRILCQIPAFFKVSKIEFNANSLSYDSLQKRSLNKFHFLHRLICFILIIQDGPLYFLAAAVLIATHLQLTKCLNDAPTQCLFINGLLGTAKHNTNKSNRIRSFIEMLNILGSYAFLPTTTINYLGFIYGIHWTSPCKPSLIGYFILPQCWDEQGYEKKKGHILIIWNTILKILVCLVNQWAWAIGSYVCGYVIAGLQIMCGITLYEFLDTFNQPRALKNPVDNIYKSGQLYRTLQVLSTLRNEVQQGAFMVAIICGGVFTQAGSLAGFVLVPWTKENLFWITTYGVSGLYAAVALLVILGEMAEGFEKSKRLLEEHVNEHFICGSQKVKKWTKRFYKSCTPLKSKFGELNFVERLTPLKCLNLGNEIAVNILLLSGRFSV